MTKPKAKKVVKEKLQHFSVQRVSNGFMMDYCTENNGQQFVALDEAEVVVKLAELLDITLNVDLF